MDTPGFPGSNCQVLHSLFHFFFRSLLALFRVNSNRHVFDNLLFLVLGHRCDIEDALGKLQRLGLALEENGSWTVIPLDEANQKLDELWDGYYDFSANTSSA